MDLLVPWLIFPLVLGALALGLGLLLERAAEIRLPGALVLPAGFAVLIVVAQFATLTDLTADLAVPLAVVLAGAGLALSRRRGEGKLDAWALAAAAGAFAVFAAPIVFSGEATFAGYGKLADTATWLGLTDRVMEHGRSVSGLAPSTYQIVLNGYLAGGYPVGAFVPLGVGRAIVGQDAAWLFQPYTAFLGAMLVLALYAIAERVVEQRWLAALVASVAAQAALLFGYSLWGGAKEIAAAAILALVAASVPVALDRPGVPGVVAPLAIACGAMVGVLSLGGVVWLLPVAAVLLLVGLRGRAFTLEQAGWFALLTGFVSLPAIVAAINFFEPASVILTRQSELGKLSHSLSLLQIFGIWPTGDLRRSPSELAIADVLIAITALAALGGIYWAWRRRAWGLPGYLASAALGCVVIVLISSPWVDAKAFAIASPAFVLAGLCGAVALSRRSRALAALAVMAITAGVLWSNVLAYHEVNLAPRDRLAEITRIGETIEGEGPTLMAEYEPFASRHFLRDADPEALFDKSSRAIDLQAVSISANEAYTDIDLLQPSALLAYRTIVLRRSPVGSRPPTPYRLVKRLRFYEIWQRSADLTEAIVAKLPLGSLLTPAGTARCGDILKYASVAGRQDRLSVAQAPTPIVVGLGQSQHPSAWRTSPHDPLKIRPTSSGTLETSFDAPRAGRYDAWIGGSFRGGLEISINGRQIWSAHHVLNRPQAYLLLGTPTLPAGTSRVTLRYDLSDLRPGSGGSQFPLGPLALTPANAPRSVASVPVVRARELCGKQLDWLEILRPATVQPVVPGTP